MNTSAAAVVTANWEPDPPKPPDGKLWKDFSPGHAENEKEGAVETLLRFSFKNPTKGQGVNVANSHFGVLSELIKVDPEMKIYRNDKEEPMDISKEYPETEDDYKKAFHIVDKETLPNKATMVSVVHRVTLTKKIADIKFDKTNGFLEYLQAEKVDVVADLHYGARRGAAGMLFKMHPKLYYRHYVAESIKKVCTQMEFESIIDKVPKDKVEKYFHIKITDETVDDEAMEEDGFTKVANQKKTDTTSNKEIVDLEKPIKVPNFEVVPKLVYAGNKENRTVAETFEIQCADEDINFIKLLFTKIGQENKIPFNGIFFPKTSLMTTVEKNQFIQMLHHQLKYLKNTTRITVQGLKKKALEEPTIKTRQDTMISLHAVMLQKGVTAIVPTIESETKGKFAFIVDKTVVNNIRRLIDTRVKQHYESGKMPNNEEYRFQDMWIPQRTDTPRNDGNVISYAQQVLNEFNPQDGEQATVQPAQRKQQKKRNNFKNSPKLSFVMTKKNVNTEEFPSLPKPTSPSKSPLKKKTKGSHVPSYDVEPTNLFGYNSEEAMPEMAWNSMDPEQTTPKIQNMNHGSNQKQVPRHNVWTPNHIASGSKRPHGDQHQHETQPQKEMQQYKQTIDALVQRVEQLENILEEKIHKVASQSEEQLQKYHNASEERFERMIESNNKKLQVNIDQSLQNILGQITDQLRINSSGPGTNNKVAGAQE